MLYPINTQMFQDNMKVDKWVASRIISETWLELCSNFMADIFAYAIRQTLKKLPLQSRQIGAMASQITSLTIVYPALYSGADQRKHQSSASLAFVRWNHRWPVNSPHKWPVTRKMFPFHDVIMPQFVRAHAFTCDEGGKHWYGMNIWMKYDICPYIANRVLYHQTLLSSVYI